MGINWKFFAGSLLASFLVFGVIFNLPKVIHAAQTINSTSVDGLSSVTVLANASITGAVTATLTAQGTSNWGATGWRIDSGTETCVNTPNHTTGGPFTETFPITAPSGPGTYNVTFTIYANDNASCNGASTSSTLVGAIVILPIGSPSPSALPSPTPQRQGNNICHNTQSQGNPWQGLHVDDDGQLEGHFAHGDFDYGNGPLNNNGHPDNSQSQDAVWCLALAQQTNPSPSPNPSPAPSSTPDPGSTDICANIAGDQTSVPDGLHLDASGRNCVSFELGGNPGGGGGTGSVLGASTSSGKVLGASTTANAGTAEDMIGLVLVLSGTILVGTSFNAYRKVYAQ